MLSFGEPVANLGFAQAAARGPDHEFPVCRQAAWMLSMSAESDLLEPIRNGADFTLYRGRERGNPSPVLAVAPAAEQPSPQSLRRLKHEYSLATELDTAWAAKPLALTRHEGERPHSHGPGGEPLDRVIERDKGRPLDLARFLRIAIGLASALGQAHRQGLIHKDIKPANALVDAPVTCGSPALA